MAIDGHPFHTEALDAQRARQRRLLAGLPSHWVTDWRSNGSIGALTKSPRHMEEVLREHADHLAADTGIGRLLDQAFKATSGEMLFAASLELEPEQRQPGAWDVPKLLVDQTAGGVHQVFEGLDDDGYKFMHAWMLYTIEADRLAGDYLDPRLQAAEPHLPPHNPVR